MTLNDFIEQKIAEFMNRPLGSRIGHTEFLRSALRECAEKTVQKAMAVQSHCLHDINCFSEEMEAWLGTNNQPQ